MLTWYPSIKVLEACTVELAIDDHGLLKVSLHLNSLPSMNDPDFLSQPLKPPAHNAPSDALSDTGLSICRDVIKYLVRNQRHLFHYLRQTCQLILSIVNTDLLRRDH